MEKYNLTELNKLEKYLRDNGYNVERIDCDEDMEDVERHQVIIYDDDNQRQWDAICQPGSYGCRDGLLEIYGSIVDKKREDLVVGYLTADDVIARLKPWEASDM